MEVRERMRRLYIIFEEVWKKSKMKIEFEDYEKDLLIETIQHRLDTDKILVINTTLKEELEDLLMKVEDDEYL